MHTCTMYHVYLGIILVYLEVCVICTLLNLGVLEFVFLYMRKSLHAPLAARESLIVDPE